MRTTIQLMQCDLVELATEERLRYVHWQELLAKARAMPGDKIAKLDATDAHVLMLRVRHIRVQKGGTKLPWHTALQRTRYEGRRAAHVAALKARQLGEGPYAEHMDGCEVHHGCLVDPVMFAYVMGRPYDPEREAFRHRKGATRKMRVVRAEMRARGELG